MGFYDSWCREKAPFMLLIEVLSNDEGSVTEDAKYSAGSSAAVATASAPRPAGSRGKSVAKPYTPPEGHKADADSPGKCCPPAMLVQTTRSTH